MGTCAFCGERFAYGATGPKARTCSGRCRAALWHRDHPKPVRVYACRVCAAEIVVAPGSMCGPRSLCDRCLEVGPSVAIVQLRLGGDEHYICPCGTDFVRPLTKGQRPRWCSPACMRRLKVGARRLADYRRRSRMAAAEAEQFEPVEIYDRDGWRCQVPGCGRRVKRAATWPHPLSPSIDHIIPVSEGGGHVRVNVRCAHLRCNTARGNRGGSDQLLLIG